VFDKRLADKIATNIPGHQVQEYRFSLERKLSSNETSASGIIAVLEENAIKKITLKDIDESPFSERWEVAVS
jgi:hypothetical protein